MSTWILVMIMYPGSNAGLALTIPNLPTYQECVRVQREIIAMRPNRLDDSMAKCIEVRK